MDVDETRFLWWMNKEIPAYLDKFSTYEEFDKRMISAAASFHWKAMAYAMAKVKWNIDKVVHIAR